MPGAASLISARREATRQQIVMLMWVIFWLIIFDGTLRKWILPMLATPLVVLKDPFVLASYWLGITASLWNMRSVTFRLSLGVTALFCVLPILQISSAHLPVGMAFFAIRQYAFYIPLCFLVGEVLRGSDLATFVRSVSWAGIINGVIVFLQYRLPNSHWINKSFETGKGASFTYGSDNLARASGTFTFTFQHEVFCGLLLATTLSLLLLPDAQRPMRGIWLWITVAACGINVMLDGNRGVFVHVLYALGFAVVAAAVGSNVKATLTRLAVLALGVALSGLIYVTVFKDASRNMKERFDRAEQGQGLVRRFVHPYEVIWNELRAITPLGEGCCSESGAAKVLNLRPAFREREESEVGRVLIESGVSGIFFSLLRVIISFQLLGMSFLATRRSQNPLPFMMASFVMMTLPNGLLTSNVNAVPMTWFCAGVTMAACQLGRRRN